MDEHANLPRRTLQTNSVSSAGSGVAAIGGAGVLTDELGTRHQAVPVVDMVLLFAVLQFLGLRWSTAAQPIAG